MSPHCLNQEDLLALIENDTLPLAEAHLLECAKCTQELSELREIARILGEPTAEDTRLAHALTKAVMEQVHAIPQRTPLGVVRILHRAPKLYSALAIAAAVLLGLGIPWSKVSQSGFQARGNNASRELNLAKRSGVMLYRLENSRPVAIQKEATLSPKDAFVAGYRNLEQENAVYFAAFLVDSKQQVHWLYPAFEQRENTPFALPLPPSQYDRLLDASVTFADIAAGPARFVLLRTSASFSIAELDALPPAELAAPALLARFGNGVLDEIHVNFAPDDRAAPDDNAAPAAPANSSPLNEETGPRP